MDTSNSEPVTPGVGKVTQSPFRSWITCNTIRVERMSKKTSNYETRVATS